MPRTSFGRRPSLAEAPSYRKSTGKPYRALAKNTERKRSPRRDPHVQPFRHKLTPWKNNPPPGTIGRTALRDVARLANRYPLVKRLILKAIGVAKTSRTRCRKKRIPLMTQCRRTQSQDFLPTAPTTIPWQDGENPLINGFHHQSVIDRRQA